jgi:hypothetical protein
MTSPHYDEDPCVARFSCNSHKQAANTALLCIHVLICTVTFKQTSTIEIWFMVLLSLQVKNYPFKDWWLV